MRALDFNRLPPDTRQRIVACFDRKAPPYAILSQQTSPGAATVGWGILLLMGLGGAIVLAAAEFGSSYSFRQGYPFILAYAFAFFIVIFSVIRMLKVRVKKGALPFKPGTYVFPLDLVHVDDETLKVYPLTELLEMQPTHHYTNGVYQQTSFRFTFQGGSQFTLSVAPKAKAEQTLNYFREVRGQVVTAAEKRDFATLQQMDLFATPRMNDSWAAFEPSAGIQATPIPKWLNRAALFALGPAVLLALPAYFLRNFVSDESAYRNLKTYGTTYNCESYVSRGGRHADEVQRLELPRSFLREMKEKKSALAIRYFFKRFPSTEIQSEANQALTEAIASDFAAAKVKGSVSAMREFLRDNPGAPQEASARAEIHRLFQKSLADFRVKASRNDPNLVPFVEQLLAHLEKYDSPPVAIKFVRAPTDSLAKADRLIEAELTPAERLAGFAKASPHFGDAQSKSRELTLVGILQRAFGTVFPADILTFVRDSGKVTTSKPKAAPDMSKEELKAEYKKRFGSDLTYEYSYTSTTDPLGTTTASTEVLPTPNSPTMLLNYRIVWSGTTYSSQQSHRMFVGILSDFDVSMTIPGAPLGKTCPVNVLKPNDPGTICPLGFALTVRPPKEFDVKSSSFIDKSTHWGDDDLVYEVMAARAYDELSAKLQDVFFHGSILIKDLETPLKTSGGGYNGGINGKPVGLSGIPTATTTTRRPVR